MKILKYVVIMLLLHSCAISNKQKSSSEESSEEMPEIDQSTPTREDFVPLAPPVFIEGSPNVSK